MGGRSDIADQVEKRAAADADDEGVPVDAEFHQPLLQPRQQRRIVLHVFAAGHHFRMRHHFHGLGVHAGIAGDVVGQRRKRGRDVGIDEGHETVTPPRLAPHQGVTEHRVVVCEQVLGEVHGILVVDRERLQVDGGAFLGALRQGGDLGAHVGRAPVRVVTRAAYLKTTASAGCGTSGSASTRGTWPRSTVLPSNSVRWSTGSGASQCDSSIWPLCA